MAPSDHTPPTDPTDPADPTDPDAQVEAALERLGPLDELPVDEHVAVYDEVHRDLHAALVEPTEQSEGDERPHPPEPPAGA